MAQRKIVSVIGGGPAGIMAAVTAAKSGHKVTLYEKNDRLGVKLSITGGGRCNLTYAAPVKSLIDNVVSNRSFLYSAFNAFGSEDLIKFIEDLNVPLIIENSRVFTESGKAGDVVKALEALLYKSKVQVELNSQISDIKEIYKQSEALVIATGGLSYPGTGSSGDGYSWAKSFGHSVTGLYPALTPIYLKSNADLAGISLENAGISIIIKDSPKPVYTNKGALLFTHKGISGPAVLEAGGYVARHMDANPQVAIDFMPELSASELDDLLLELISKSPNKSLANILSAVLPGRLAAVLATGKKANTFTKAERKLLISYIKNKIFQVADTGGFREAMVTAGGVNVKEVNPSDMSSKKAEGLYFAGEILDVDALTGGFNLQIAFSTGYLAGASI